MACTNNFPNTANKRCDAERQLHGGLGALAGLCGRLALATGDLRLGLVLLLVLGGLGHGRHLGLWRGLACRRGAPLGGLAGADAHQEAHEEDDRREDHGGEKEAWGGGGAEGDGK